MDATRSFFDSLFPPVLSNKICSGPHLASVPIRTGVNSGAFDTVFVDKRGQDPRPDCLVLYVTTHQVTLFSTLSYDLLVLLLSFGTRYYDMMLLLWSAEVRGGRSTHDHDLNIYYDVNRRAEYLFLLPSGIQHKHLGAVVTFESNSTASAPRVLKVVEASRVFEAKTLLIGSISWETRE